MSKVVRIHAFGGPEVLRLDEVEIGPPGPGEVRIRVGAFGLNRVEALYRAGHFHPASFPARIGYEAAGVIEAVGDGVTAWQPGDRVATLFGLSMEAYGTYGETILYPADMLVPVGPEQFLRDAAASWMQYGTAFGIIELGHAAQREAIVITAASSSVGVAAIQIAKACGATAIAVTRGRGKAERLAALGADHVVVSDEEDVAARVLDITGGTGARIAFDAVGGAPLTGLLGAIAPGGMVIVYGMLAGVVAPIDLPPMMMRNLTLRGFSADALVSDREARDRLTHYVTGSMRSGALRPVIDRCFDLADIVEAHAYLESNCQIGKIVVTTATVDD